MKIKYLVLSLMALSMIFVQCRQKEEAKQEVMTELSHPDWVKNAVIYEVNVRQYTPEGTFNAFANHIPRLKELGVDILWFMPIHPISEKNRKGTLGSYYSVKDYRAVNPEFGTDEDFKALVEKAHDAGMYVLIDWVPNHSGWDNALVEEHPEWYEKNDEGEMFSPFDWTDVVKFDYSQQGLRDYQIESMKYWVREFNIDGFRCDVAHQVPIDFWNQVHPALDELKDVFMLAEAENQALHEKAFDMTYAWEFHHIMNEIAKGEKNSLDIDEYMKKDSAEYSSNDIRLYFTSNHDENSWAGTVRERMGDAAEAMAVLSFTLPGMPLIYSGQEAGLDKRLEFFEKDEIPWREHPMNDLYEKLIQLKDAQKALWNPGFGGDYQRISTGADEQVLAFVRGKDDHKVLVLLNLDDQKASVTIPDMKGTYKEYFSGTEIDLGNSIEMNAWDYNIIVL